MKPVLAKDSVMVELRKVRDPEIGHSIVDLGLIYNVTITGDTVDVLMTLTTPFCPASEYLMTSVQDAIEGLAQIRWARPDPSMPACLHPQRLE